MHLSGNKKILFIAALCTVVLLRLAFIWQMGLMPQDAYYHFYGEHPALSYFDHPSGIAWVLKAATAIFGKKVWAIKLADTLVTSLTLIACWWLARRFLSAHRAASAWLWLFSTLMISVLSLVSTPDTPLMLGWALSLVLLERAVFGQNKACWLLAGVMMGLAFNCKYTAVLLPVGMIGFLILSPAHRRWLGTPWPWLALLAAALASLPVVLWNIDNQFVSFRFQSSSRFAGATVNILDVFGVFGHQAAILLPVLLAGLLWMIWRYLRKYGLRISRIPAPQLFLLCFFAPVFFGFLLLSPFQWIKLNWMMPAYISGIILAAMWMRDKYLYWQWIVSFVVHMVMAVEIIRYPVLVRSDDVWVGWEGLAAQVKALERKYPRDFIFSADDYKTSAVLTFYLDSLVYARNVLGLPALQFDYIQKNVSDLSGRNALFINSDPDADALDEMAFAAELKPFFREVVPLEPIIVRKGDKVLRTFLVYRCIDYRPPPSP
ncbi:glycosyltransferase family 39 protein [Chitinophaga lutea]